MNQLPRTVVKDRDGDRVEGPLAPLVSAVARYAAQRRRVRRRIIACAAILVVGLVLSFGVEMAYPGIWAGSVSERDYLALAVMTLGPFFIPVLVWFILVHPFRSLPRLDPMTRAATVTGLHTVMSLPDGSASASPVPDHQLVEVELDGEGDGSGERMLLADVVATQDLDRFAPGSVWQVRTFDRRRGRVLLAADHDDVIRIGRDLRTVRRGIDVTSVSSSTRSDEDAAGPGSTLLLWCRR